MTNSNSFGGFSTRRGTFHSDSILPRGTDRIEFEPSPSTVGGASDTPYPQPSSMGEIPTMTIGELREQYGNQWEQWFRTTDRP